MAAGADISVGGFEIEVVERCGEGPVEIAPRKVAMHGGGGARPRSPCPPQTGHGGGGGGKAGS